MSLTGKPYHKSLVSSSSLRVESTANDVNSLANIQRGGSPRTVWQPFRSLLVVVVVLAHLVFGLSDLGLGGEMAAEESHGKDQHDDSDPVVAETRLLNLQLPTIGGRQFWTDHRWQKGWRIQQNAITGHWRLLDPGNVRVAWGSRAACEQELDRHQFDRHSRQRHIVLIHGLFRSAASMQKLRRVLEDHNLGQTVLFEYASSRAAIADHADALREVVAGLPPEAPLSFVGHSMGNIVLRHAFADWEAAADQAVLGRVKSVVMLGPPNQGAAIARQLAKMPVYGWLAGQGGLELGPDWKQLEQRLGVPPCPVGIVAGRLPEGFTNPLVGEAGDFVVSVEETRLPGAELLEVNQLHSLLMDDPRVQQATAAFIEYQHFPD
jgi:hypothetical protein